MDDEQKPKEDIVELDEKGQEMKETPEIEENPEPKKIKIGETSRWHRFTNWYKGHKKKSVPLTALFLLVVVAAIPWSRYNAAGLVLKNEFSLQIMDAESKTPVSGADVNIGPIHGVSNADGEVILRNVKVGHNLVKVTKKYYKDQEIKVLVPIFKQKTTSDVAFEATGRQVKISVNNLINDDKLSGVKIEVAGTEAKTDETGTATIVLSSDKKSEKATISLSGYNTKTVDIEIDSKAVKENNLKLTPSGKIYFLSKLSGKIDVVKTNLDGSQRKTVLSGTGKEEDRGTVLLATRDWKYLALLSRRDGLNAKLHLIDTSNDRLTQIDEDASSTINPVGWSDKNFIYTVNNEKIADWKQGKQLLKSYSADTKKITLLDKTKGEGKGQYKYAFESYGTVYQIGSNVVYDKYWTADYDSTVLEKKQVGIYSIAANGTNAQTLKTFNYNASGSTYLSSVPYEASQIYYEVIEKDKPAYYAYIGGQVIAKDNIADEFDKYYGEGSVTYLVSPSGGKTFWGEKRDGKNTLLIGDADGENGKQIASLSDYQTYGWFSENYLLASKENSELYIMSVNGPTKELQPVKITDYHKPSRDFSGYGGGYGGL